MMQKEMVEKYGVILSGLEARFVHFSKVNPKLHDNDILKILDEHIRCYRAKATNFPYEEDSSNLNSEVFEESRFFLAENEAQFNSTDILESLKMIKKSLQLWNKEMGSRGYLKYISQFLINEAPVK